MVPFKSLLQTEVEKKKSLYCPERVSFEWPLLSINESRCVQGLLSPASQFSITVSSG